MKKNIILIIVLVLLTSCLTKIDLEKKGSLNLTIKWPKASSEVKAVNRAIKVGTTTIVVTIHQKGKPETTQTRTITHSNEAYHNVEFTGLIEGKWHLVIVGKDSSDMVISEYEDTIEVLEDAPTIVQTSIGGLKKIFEPYIDTAYPEQYIADGATNVNGGYLSVQYQGNVDNYINPDEAYVTFFLSDDIEFTSASAFVYPSVVNKGNEALKFVSTTSSPGALSKNTKYYWKALVLSDSSGTEQMVESSVFSFTTRLPYLPEKITTPYPTSISDGAIDVLFGSLQVPTVLTYPVDPTPDLSYVFYISSSSAFENFTTEPGFADGYVNGPSVSILPEGTKYYWKVRVENSGEGYTDSSIFSFTKGSYQILGNKNK